MAQTNLYGYLRTRAGLQHFNLFTDKTFAALLRTARSRLIIACLDDLTVFAGALPAPKLAAARQDYEARLPLIDWPARLTPQAFDASSGALIVPAPIVDDLKDYDTDIVTNSMRFKWMEVRAELRRRLDAAAVLASFG